MKILAFESSCDETAAAVVRDGRTVLSDVIASQADMHAVYGGVVPEIASRKHVEAIAGLAREALARAEETIYRLEDLWAVTDENSEIWALNHSGGAWVDLSQETADLLSQALELCALTDGALDLTAYSAVQAWGFTTGEYRVPSQEELDALIPRIDYTRLELDGDGLRARLPENMELDLGAVAKGYAGTYLAEQLRQAGVTSAILRLGGNIQAVGTRPDGNPWRVAIQDPDSQQEATLGVVEVSDQAVITSGGYQRYFEEGGETYWHIMDPDTAAPARSGLTSVTVIGADGTVCDALSTALFVMGPEEAADFWRAHPELGVELILVLEDGKEIGYGTHEELMEECEVYREISQSQMGGGSVA